jgi:hypothetical protein
MMARPRRAAEAAVVLPESSASIRDWMTFPGAFPGVFMPGVPVLLSDLGLSELEASELLAATPDLPLEQTTAKPTLSLAPDDDEQTSEE